MSSIRAMLFLVALLANGSAHAQAPTGTIAGVVTDPAGAPVADALVTITNRDSRLTRTLNTSAEGDYSAAALPPGVYRVTAQATGFLLLESTATVQVGTTTSDNLTLRIGEISEKVKVDDAAPLINYEHHQVGGVVSRAQIENLPLNGRNFLELARLEPGVTNPVPGTNNRVSVPTLGSGTQTNPRIGYTRVTVDGADINFVDSIGAALQISQEAVQEFQISTINFDLSTSVTSNAAINIVTRSGGNDFHGSVFYFYRDHNLAAYPGLGRDQSNPDPFFQRQQFGYRLGGPIWKDRAFFFTSYERNDQRGVLSIQPRTSEFAPLGGIFPSPFLGNQFNLRLDVRFSQKHKCLRPLHARRKQSLRPLRRPQQLATLGLVTPKELGGSEHNRADERPVLQPRQRPALLVLLHQLAGNTGQRRRLSNLLRCARPARQHCRCWANVRQRAQAFVRRAPLSVDREPGVAEG